MHCNNIYYNLLCGFLISKTSFNLLSYSRNQLVFIIYRQLCLLHESQAACNPLMKITHTRMIEMLAQCINSSLDVYIFFTIIFYIQIIMIISNTHIEGYCK